MPKGGLAFVGVIVSFTGVTMLAVEFAKKFAKDFEPRGR